MQKFRWTVSRNPSKRAHNLAELGRVGAVCQQDGVKSYARRRCVSNENGFMCTHPNVFRSAAIGALVVFAFAGCATPRVERAMTGEATAIGEAAAQAATK